ncbi:phosphoenolpyruvate--protein phosphotransferase [Sciscionella marina]|uniref:phosphoenolpyruvate--protein phosphotransferase n=1 Tax=Sciscionella marina TaxID=508770 RepID=UPI00037AD0DB|nr:putative PEP-binding protein [Sciscionella marina]
MTVEQQAAHGVPASPGRAAGPVLRLQEPARVSIGQPARYPKPLDYREEAARIHPAADLVAAALTDKAALATGEVRDILDMTAVMATDPSLLGTAEELVTEQGLPAARAVWDAAEQFIDGLAEAGGYLAERTGDLRDVRDRIIEELTGAQSSAVPELETPHVLLARELAPADTTALDSATVLAIVTEEGGPTSHTAIIARALGIPAVVGCTGALDLTADYLRVDGETGLVEVVTEAEAEAAPSTSTPEWNGAGATSDGVRVPLLANIGSAADAIKAADSPAEGVGLFRTEFCYLAMESEPTVEEQAEMYRAIIAVFHGKPCIVRTLDAGADKPLTFLPAEAEPNPALGVRGLRMARQHQPELLDRQLHAIHAAGGDSVMAPMIATTEEASWFAERARAARIRRVGVMIEIPSAALQAGELFEIVDFVSIGTNDLTQYTMAADRQLGTLAALGDPWQPALLRLVELTGTAGRAAGKPVGVCGEAAADPLLACVLVGLGATSLSMTPIALNAVGAELVKHAHSACVTAAREALRTRTPAEARAAARSALGR